jgi:protein-S-isoprenylcysteine O-methyltransferase Ste14
MNPDMNPDMNPNRVRARAWLLANGQRIVNYYLLANIAGFIAWQCYGSYRSGRLDFIEISFIAQNLVLAWVVLVRHDHIAIDRNPLHQLVALVAFFSGLAFMGQPATGGPTAVAVSQGLLLAANALGIATLFNLGTSFGILIACREIKTGGLYRFVRHPMYGTDILLRIGFVVSHVSLLTLSLFVLSSGCYVWRALLEERFLSGQSADYRGYMQRVRYRFVPGVF